MRFFAFWHLFSSTGISSQHKKYILWAMGIMCLEYLDIIVYIHNASDLSNIFLTTQLQRFLGIFALFIIFWFSGFAGKYLANALLHKFPHRLYRQSAMAAAAVIIAVSLFLQATVILLLGANIPALLIFFFLRLTYQTGINIIMSDTYAGLLMMHDLAGEFITLIVNSLELSLLLGIIAYKFLPDFHLFGVSSLMVFVFGLGMIWFIMAVLIFAGHIKLASDSAIKYTPSDYFAVIRKNNLKDSIIAIGLVGVRSSLCIIGVICMPSYLVQSLHLNTSNAGNIIAISSFAALLLNIWVNQHLHKFDYTNLVKFGLVGMIMGCLVSYMLFFFQVVPLLAVMILVIFHSLFALSCPMILNNLFTPEIRSLAIVSCYRNSFFIFSSISFVVLILFTQVLHEYIFPPAILLILITGACYGCMLLFNRQLGSALSAKNKTV